MGAFSCAITERNSKEIGREPGFTGEKNDSHYHIRCCEMLQRAGVPSVNVPRTKAFNTFSTKDSGLSTSEHRLLALRQQDGKRRSPPFLTFNGDGALMLFNNALDDRQP